MKLLIMQFFPIGLYYKDVKYELHECLEVYTSRAVRGPKVYCTPAGVVCSFSRALAVKIHRNTAYLFLVLYDQYCPLPPPPATHITAIVS
jgi:hypothetical protein